MRTTFFVGKREWKRPLEKPTCRWEDIKANLYGDTRMYCGIKWLKTESSGGLL
jgi:hypothetical protein